MNKQYEECKLCGSTNLEDGDYEIKDVNLFIERYCMDCDFVWFEVYEFMHNENEFGDIPYDD